MTTYRSGQADRIATPDGRVTFSRARHETVRYHEKLYASTKLGQEGTWLANPHPLVFEALDLLPSDRAAVAYDLGAGVGRHTFPLLERLPAGSVVHAVDLLRSALDRLEADAPDRTATTLCTQQADLDDFEFGSGADLVLAFSAVEHLPRPAAVRRLLQRIRAAVVPGGVVALGVVADRVEIAPDGSRRAALVESGLTAAATRMMLEDVFGDFTVERVRCEPTEVAEERDGESYTLASTLLTWTGVRPGGGVSGPTDR